MQQQVDNKTKRRTRPAQMLYVPPAQRNRRPETEVPLEKQPDPKNTNNPKETEAVINVKLSELPSESARDIKENVCKEEEIVEKENRVQEKDEEKTLVIMLDSIKTAPDKSDLDVEQEEMQRAIVNINRKSRPLIKHVNVGKNDVLHIDVNEKENRKAPKAKIPTNLNIESWEDLLNEDNEDFNEEYVDEPVPENKCSDEDDLVRDETPVSCIKNRLLSDLEHVIELYDFPPSFRSQDIMQLYHDVHKDTYLRWCDDTHALLVFSTPAVAQKALQIHHDIIKSRPMGQASHIAAQTAAKSDLKPAMKRPQTTMQTARRMISTHLGTKSRISKEEQERERELLRQAKALKLAQKQSEKDAWEGNPRPSTA